jgi:hypothetical protein
MGFQTNFADNHIACMMLNSCTHRKNYEINRKILHCNRFKGIQGPARGDGAYDTQFSEPSEGIEIDTRKSSIRTQQGAVEIHDKQSPGSATLRGFGKLMVYGDNHFPQY